MAGALAFEEYAVEFDSFLKGPHDSVIPILTDGKIIVFRQLPEILNLRQIILHEIAGTGGTGGTALHNRIDRFFKTKTFSSLEEIVLLYRKTKEIRDKRLLSIIFHDLVLRLGLPEPILIDPGHFRFVLPRIHQELKRRTDLISPADFQNLSPLDPEIMLTGSPGWVHRDLDTPHSHIQLNFWFCLHDATEEETLLIYPEKYKEKMDSYIPPNDWNDPNTSVYGRALTVSLQFGDALLFHSQMLHGSPTQLAATENRLSVELRCAASCIDSNHSYRRLFSKLENFKPRPRRSGIKNFFSFSILKRALSSSSQSFQQTHSPTDLAKAIKMAQAPIEVFNNLFHADCWGFSALDCFSPDHMFWEARSLNKEEANLVKKWLSGIDFTEDLAIAVCRVLLRSGHSDEAETLLNEVIERTPSYFWAHEAARHALPHGLLETSVSGLEKALQCADNADVTLGAFSPDIPVQNPIPNTMQPVHAIRAANYFLEFLNKNQLPAGEQRFFLDHRLFTPGWSIRRTYENGRVFYGHCLWLFVPSEQVFIPEDIIANSSACILRPTWDALQAGSEAVFGGELQIESKPPLELIESTETFNILQFYGFFVAIPQGYGDFSPLDVNMLEIDGSCFNSSLDEIRGRVSMVESTLKNNAS